jgi:hypothetical protein
MFSDRFLIDESAALLDAIYPGYRQPFKEPGFGWGILGDTRNRRPVPNPLEFLKEFRARKAASPSQVDSLAIAKPSQ